VSSKLSGGSVPVSPQTAGGQAPELSSLAQWINKTPRTVRKEPQTPTPTPAAETADPPAGEAMADDKRLSDSPDDLLTSEELTALLEDES